ncbi:MAG: 2-hydroxyacyl-CoA dehydratase [Planctomycetota bacterium]|jgi:benzoyl-CoA reductase/2-hydroxyglutaryl-CoA dehydratase subunit BcrC/BadD/HgdB
MKTIIYTCPYVPAEWIAAHGLCPSRIIPDAAGTTGPLGRTEGVCPFVQGFINEVMADKQSGGVVITTVCDQMRRAYDILVRRCDAPLFLMNVPNTWQNVAVQKLYIDELKRLGRFLIGLGDKSPSNNALAKIMLNYDTARTSILTAGGYLPARQYAETIAAFGRDGPGETLNNVPAPKQQIEGIPLAIFGGPLMRQDFDIFDIVEAAGGHIVLDATETGQRGMCAPFDRLGLRDKPLLELASAYFSGIQDASRRPNSGLYKWLKSRLTDTAVCGIIFHRYVWCDMWHAELQRLKDWTDLPVLDIDTGGNNETAKQRTTNRIRAFLETLQ